MCVVNKQMRYLRGFIFLALLANLYACGQKGKLVMPPSDEVVPSQPTTTQDESKLNGPL